MDRTGETLNELISLPDVNSVDGGTTNASSVEMRAQPLISQEDSSVSSEESLDSNPSEIILISSDNESLESNTSSEQSLDSSRREVIVISSDEDSLDSTLMEIVQSLYNCTLCHHSYSSIHSLIEHSTTHIQPHTIYYKEQKSTLKLVTSEQNNREYVFYGFNNVECELREWLELVKDNMKCLLVSLKEMYTFSLDVCLKGEYRSAGSSRSNNVDLGPFYVDFWSRGSTLFGNFNEFFAVVLEPLVNRIESFNRVDNNLEFQCIHSIVIKCSLTGSSVDVGTGDHNVECNDDDDVGDGDQDNSDVAVYRHDVNDKGGSIDCCSGSKDNADVLVDRDGDSVDQDRYVVDDHGFNINCTLCNYTTRSIFYLLHHSVTHLQPHLIYQDNLRIVRLRNSAFQGRIRDYVINEVGSVPDVRQWFNLQKPILKCLLETLSQSQALLLKACLILEYKAVNINSDSDGIVSETKYIYFWTRQQSLFLDFDSWYSQELFYIVSKTDSFHELGSNIVFQRVQGLLIKCTRNSQYAGRGLVKLPSDLKKKSVVLNVVTESSCFKYAILAALHYNDVKSHRNCKSSYAKWLKDIDFGGIDGDCMSMALFANDSTAESWMNFR